MALAAVLAFWGLSFTLVMTPGADWAYMIGTGLRRQPVLPAVTGLVIGYLCLTAALAVGVAALVASSHLTLTILTVGGAGYLLWLGAMSLAHPVSPQAASETTSAPWLTVAVKGAGVSGFNPKALLLFLAVLPQFVDRSGNWPIASQIALLGLLHTASCAAVYTGVGIGARAVLSTRPSWARAVSRLSGAAMMTIGAAILIEQLMN